MLKKIDSIWDKLANWILVITGIAICTLIFAGAFMRYILHTDFYGSEEIILLMAFWFYFIGSSLAAKHDTHFKAEMLGMFVRNPRTLEIANILKNTINLLVALLACNWSVQYVIWNINMHVKSSVFRFPMALAVIPIAISFTVWTLYCIRDIAVEMKKFGMHSAELEGKEQI